MKLPSSTFCSPNQMSLFGRLFILLSICFLSLPNRAFSQELTDSTDSLVFVVVEKPEYQGGEKALRRYIEDSIPDSLRSKNGFEANVYVKFIIKADGEVDKEKTKILRSPHPKFDQAAMDIINNMPNWKPGMKDGNPADVHMMVPIKF